MIAFQSSATAGDISTFLSNYGLSMAEGPNQDGTYKVRVNSGNAPDEMLQSMRSQSNVVSSVASS
jgi:hypothetical protein